MPNNKLRVITLISRQSSRELIPILRFRFNTTFKLARVGFILDCNQAGEASHILWSARVDLEFLAKLISVMAFFLLYHRQRLFWLE